MKTKNNYKHRVLLHLNQILFHFKIILTITMLSKIFLLNIIIIARQNIKIVSVHCQILRQQQVLIKTLQNQLELL